MTPTFSKETYVQRRAHLKRKLGSGVLLFLGHPESPMNYKDNTYAFRQDSSFLYFFGLDRPNLCALIDLEENQEVVFGDELTIDDIVWMGNQPSIRDQAASVGIQILEPISSLRKALSKATASGRRVHYLPPYRSEHTVKLHETLGIPLSEVATQASVDLIRAVVSIRSKKTPEEINEIESALAVTRQMHIAIMQAAREGLKECDLVGIAQGIASGADRLLAYPMILTVHGQILHNHDHSHSLTKGKLVLADLGSESLSHYASDITRTFPVDRTFTALQREIYSIVLEAQLACIHALKPGTLHREVHLEACRHLVEGLKSMGLMKGSTEEAVQAGAHALFFPHGLGHMLGLDVHDMEDLGETFVGYTDDVQRSPQFGLRGLRLARALEPGFVLTVEPGIYFIPELIDQWMAEKKHADFIHYEAVNRFRDFGGIRIEDNCVITENGARVLGEPIPKTLVAIEELRGSASN